METKLSTRNELFWICSIMENVSPVSFLFCFEKLMKIKKKLFPKTLIQFNIRIVKAIYRKQEIWEIVHKFWCIIMTKRRIISI